MELLIPALIAGFLMFLAPCTLPIVPGYLAFISGVSEKDASRARRAIFRNGVFFVLGFCAVFIFFGTVAGALGTHLGEFRVVAEKVGGIVIVLFGLMMLTGLSFPQFSLRMPKTGTSLSSFLIGASFGVGWTPCIGPILASILLLATLSTSALEGAILLAVFSLGMAIPFLIIAAFIGQLSQTVERFSRHLKYISAVGGVFLILLGLMIFFGNFGLTIEYGYKLFEFINYEGLLNYL